MKKFFWFPILIAVAVFVSCQKQQTEAEKNADVEGQVQQRLAAERQAQERQQLAQREADLSVREKALAEQESPAATTPEPTVPMAQLPHFTSLRQRMHDAAGNPATATYATFYTKLEPYGAWFETSDYGYVWQPREAESSRSWRPYTDGRWVYTDAGWTWISEEPFGWAAYHYGRWTRLHNIGWVWVPGDQWAPAWVSWRTSNDYVGWAPLPPEARFDRDTGIRNWSDNYYDIGPDQYAFVATNEFGAQRIQDTLLPRERNAAIVDQTTNVTSITYNNTTIVNQGPNYDELRKRSREPVQRLRLQRENLLNENFDARAVVQGDAVVITAPVIAVPQASDRPRAVKETIAQTTVDLGWDAISDHQAADKARKRMKSEAPPPANLPSKKFTKPTSESNIVAANASTTSTEAPSNAPVEAQSAISKSADETPKPTATPQLTPAPTSTSAPSSAVSPTHGRMLKPMITPMPHQTASPTQHSSAAPTQTPASTGSAAPFTTPSPIPSPKKHPELKSQAQKFQPRRVVPMTSPESPSPSATASTSPIAPEPKLTKEERKKEKREEKEQKRDHKGPGGTSEIPSPSPQSSP